MSVDAYDKEQVEMESYKMLQDEYEKLKTSYQSLRKEHLEFKNGVVKCISNCWEKIDDQYGCKEASMSEANRLSSMDISTRSSSDVCLDVKTQIETMLRQVFINCEITKKKEIEAAREAARREAALRSPRLSARKSKSLSETSLTDPRPRKDDEEETKPEGEGVAQEGKSPEEDEIDLDAFFEKLELITKTSEAYSKMLDNVSLRSLIKNAPNESIRGRCALSNKTIAQVLSQLSETLTLNKQEADQRLKDLHRICLEVLTDKANLTMMWNNQFLTSLEYSSPPPKLRAGPRHSYSEPRNKTGIRVHPHTPLPSRSKSANQRGSQSHPRLADMDSSQSEPPHRDACLPWSPKGGPQ